MIPDSSAGTSESATTALGPSYVPELWTYRYEPGELVAPYGDDTTYRDGLGWLWETCCTVEDWGAGAAYGRKFTPPGKTYVAVDGSPESAPHVDHVSELHAWRIRMPRTYPDGIFIRHVLEHDLNWRQVLTDALSFFVRRMVLVTFTPFTSGPTRPLRPPGDYRYDLSFNTAELTSHFDGFRWRMQGYRDRERLQYGQEHLFRIERAS